MNDHVLERTVIHDLESDTGGQQSVVAGGTRRNDCVFIFGQTAAPAVNIRLSPGRLVETIVYLLDTIFSTN